MIMVSEKKSNLKSNFKKRCFGVGAVGSLIGGAEAAGPWGSPEVGAAPPVVGDRVTGSRSVTGSGR